jgi:DNA-binding transcriptional regulator of glucitol operon
LGSCRCTQLSSLTTHLILRRIKMSKFTDGFKKVGSGFATVGAGVKDVAVKVATPVATVVDDRLSLRAAKQELKEEMIADGRQTRAQAREAALREKLAKEQTKLANQQAKTVATAKAS